MLFVVVLSTLFAIAATLLLREWAHGDLRPAATATVAPRPVRTTRRERPAGEGALLRRQGVPSGRRHRMRPTPRPATAIRPDGNGMAVERMRRCRPSPLSGGRRAA